MKKLRKMPWFKYGLCVSNYEEFKRTMESLIQQLKSKVTNDCIMVETSEA